MTLAEDIQVLKDRALTELSVAHDYYADTKIAWKIVHKFIQSGRKVTIRNLTTKSVTTEAELANKSRGYVTFQLAEATFQQFVSIFEHFVFELLRLWLMEYPRSLGCKKLSFKTVLDAPDKEAVTLDVVKKELNEIAYQKPKDWFKYLDEKVMLHCPTEDEIDRISEAKASRDILVHNRGIVNKIYLDKSGNWARYKDGQKLEIPEPYHRETWELIRKVIGDVSDAAIAKTV